MTHRRRIDDNDVGVTTLLDEKNANTVAESSAAMKCIINDVVFRLQIKLLTKFNVHAFSEFLYFNQLPIQTSTQNIKS
jgi:hypothetical protein